MDTWHLHIEGQVQGVGFRPFIYVLAQEFGLTGWVNNTVDGVHIECNAGIPTIQAFQKAILAKAPRLSRITQMHLQRVEDSTFEDFQIVKSEGEGAARLLLTPDFALCEDCRRELHEADNRRLAYPFITCTHCGPRYSITRQLPYDRDHTTMDAFQMCPTCQAEYENPLDRRFYSQTNSCMECGINLKLYQADRQLLSDESEAVQQMILEAWSRGEIVALKGIGGYLLTCDAENEAAVSVLRQRKHRPSKPFAVMYPSIESMTDLKVPAQAAKALKSAAAPIVLLECQASASLAKGIAPGLDRLGVMLPYTPLYDCLLHAYGKPIVATSGNVSQSPIVYQDEKALNQLSAISDYVLVHDRDIVVPQDDSVIHFTPIQQQRIVLRRSRGFAPTYLDARLKWPDSSILSMGAMLKSTFCLLHQRQTYISPYIGDLEHYETQQSYRYSLEHFLRLFDVQPEVILCDSHPTYPSTNLGQQWANDWQVPIHQVQHHLAHFGAILGEHNLMHQQEPVLGMIWDGTGLGSDGQIWGGEFFTYENYHFQRCGQLAYFNFILGDKMPKEPRISALSACWQVEGATEILRPKFTKTEWQVYAKLLARERQLQTSSMGRLFDAVASLLGLMDRQSYEGEAAMRLEALARSYFNKNGLEISETYANTTGNGIDTKAWMHEIIQDIQVGKARDFIAAKFHYSLVNSIRQVASALNISRIAFSGGVFQNSLLVDLLQHHLRDAFELYWHQQLSPNDENISFGQQICYQIEKKKDLLIQHKSDKYVFSDSR